MNQEEKKRFISRLKKAGVDYDVALRRLVGNEEIYFLLMQEFLNDHNFIQLKDCIERKNSAVAFKYSYTIKSLAANIGFDKCLKSNQKLIELLGRGEIEGSEELVDSLEKEYDVLRDIIKDYL